MFKGAAGLSNVLRQNPRFVNRCATIVPAIFTTAQLFTTNVLLETATLATGNLPELGELTSHPWLWYQQNLSYSLLSDVRGRFIAEKQPDLTAFTRSGHTRSTAIIAVDGIVPFLDWMRST